MADLTRHDKRFNGIDFTHHVAALKDARKIGCPCIRNDDDPYKYLCLAHYPEWIDAL